MSEVIVRSLATSFTAALPVFALMVFGGETLRDFAFALFIGTLSGTYSSVFIAAQVLTAWKEREPVYRRRHAAVAAAHGGVVPAYATATGGAPVDVEPARQLRRRGSLTAPDDPTQVSRHEFDEMVRDLHADPKRAPTAVEEPDESADADPSELYIKGDREKKDRKPRNRRHGRPR
jgi:SecD/SecF fusion protein